MGAGLRTDVEVTGLDKLLHGLTQLQGAALAKQADKIAKPAASGTLVKAIKAETKSFKGHGKPNRKSKNGEPYKGQDAKPLADTITARKARKRPGELFAYSVGPRKFTRYWVVRGTAPHDITAGARRDGHGQFKAAGRGAKALHIDGLYRSSAHHPGSKSNDFVYRGSRGRGEAAAAAEMQKSWDRYVKRVMATK